MKETTRYSLHINMIELIYVFIVIKNTKSKHDRDRNTSILELLQVEQYRDLVYKNVVYLSLLYK